MRYIQSVVLAAMVLLAASPAVHAQNLLAVAAPLPEAPSHQRFWTTENKVEFSVLASLIATDAITTQRGLNQGLREGNPLMRPFVTRGATGEAAGSALGFGAGLGTAYLLHQTHHYKAERITMRLIVAGESAMVANNIVALR